MKKRVIIIFILLIVISSAILYYLFTSRPFRPNIVMILIDALRKDHLRCYGYYRNTSPKIDEFAEDAFQFQNCISTCSWTSPSIASLFTSLYVSGHGLMTHSQKSTDILGLQFATLAEVLKKNGYTTSAFIANRWIREEFNYHQGFDVFEQVGGNLPRPSAAAVKEKVLAWLNNKPREPFFTYVHFMDVHGPYYPPYPYNTFFTSEEKRELTPQEYKKLRYLKVAGQTDLNFYINQYDGEIRYCDYHIGKILQYLKDADLYDDSLIILTSDHGEAFFEHGACDHGFTLYNEEIRVPLIIRFPTSFDFTINASIKPQLIDIGVTILDLMGAAFPYEVDGLSLISFGKKKGVVSPRKRIYSEEYMKGFPKVSMIERDMKYTYHISQERIVEGYDLAKDDTERQNLLKMDENVDSKGAIAKEIQAWLLRNEDFRNLISTKRDQAEIDPHTLEQLKSLGYIQYEGKNDH